MSSIRSKVAAIAGTIIVAASVLVAPAATAAPVVGFNPGNIISDAEFFKGEGMTELQIQAFLNAKVPNCDTGSAYRNVCLKDITMSMQARAGDHRCDPISAGSNLTAAAIIARIGLACDINPKVILVTLQKERGLVTKRAPSSSDYKVAMGYGCPDTAACSTEYYGFANQVFRASRQFQTYRLSPTYFNFRANVTRAIQYHPNAACGTKSVYIENAATAALYNYTPYTPNQAALDAGWGTGNSCSSYGNRNFFSYYADWFGTQSAGDDSPVALQNGGFEAGDLGAWTPSSSAVIATPQFDTDERPAFEGNRFLELNTTSWTGTLRQDIIRAQAEGDSFTASAWVRSGVPGTTVSGQLGVSGIGGTNESILTPFVAGDEWQRVDSTLTMDRTGHYVLRVNLVVNEKKPLQFDSVIVVKSDTPGEPPEPEAPTEQRITVPNASFEAGSISPWTTSSAGSTLGLVPSTAESPAYHGVSFVAMTAATFDDSVRIDLNRNSSQGQSYTASAWVRSATGQPVSGEIALAARGNGGESTRQPITIGPEWTFVSVTHGVVLSGHNSLRIAFYVDNSAGGLHIDNVALITGSVSHPGEAPTPPPVEEPPVEEPPVDEPGIIVNPSFEGGAVVPWKQGLGNTVTMTVRTTAKSLPVDNGTKFLQIRTSKPSASANQDVPFPVTTGDKVQVSAWVRSESQSASTKGQLAIAGIGGTNESIRVPFTVSGTWKKVTATLTMQRAHDTIRIAFYVDTANRGLLVDNVEWLYPLDGSVGEPPTPEEPEPTDPGGEEPDPPHGSDLGLLNPSFEDGAIVPWEQGKGGVISLAVRATAKTLPEGNGVNFLVASTSQPSASFNQDLDIALTPGSSYRVTAWVRAESMTSTARGQIALAGLTNPTESVRSAFTVDKNWRKVSVTITPIRSHSQLRVAFYVDQANRALLIDGIEVENLG